MSLDKPNPLSIDGSRFRIGIVAARFNQDLVDALLNRVLECLDASGVAADSIETVRVPGSGEIPYAVSMLSDIDGFDCLIALGVVIAGGTSHHEIIGSTTAKTLQDIATTGEAPVINGIIVCDSLEQAKERVGEEVDRGTEFARAALEMAEVKVHLCQRLDETLERDAEAEAEQILGELMQDNPNWEDYLAEDYGDEDDEDEEPWKS